MTHEELVAYAETLDIANIESYTDEALIVAILEAQEALGA